MRNAYFVTGVYPPTGLVGASDVRPFPQQYLVPGDELVSSIEGLGEIRQRFVARSEPKNAAGLLEAVGGRA